MLDRFKYAFKTHFFYKLYKKLTCILIKSFLFFLSKQVKFFCNNVVQNVSDYNLCGNPALKVAFEIKEY